MLFGKKAPPNILAGVERLVIEANQLALMTEHSGVHLKGKFFSLSSEEVRERVVIQVREARREMGSDYSAWPQFLKDYLASAQTRESEIAGLVLVSCSQIETALGATQEFSRDRQLRSMCLNGVTTLMVTLSVLFPGADLRGMMNPIVTQKFGVVEAPSVFARELLWGFSRIREYLQGVMNVW